MKQLLFKIVTLTKNKHQAKVRLALIELTSDLVKGIEGKQNLSEEDITTMLDKAFKILMEKVGR